MEKQDSMMRRFSSSKRSARDMLDEEVLGEWGRGKRVWEELSAVEEELVKEGVEPLLMLR